MKKMIMRVFILLAMVVAGSSFMLLNDTRQQASLNGAWRLQNGTEETVWVFVDGYSVQTTFDKTAKRFISTWGGPYMIQGGKLGVKVEFNTANAGSIGQTESINFSLRDGKLGTDMGSWKRIDDGTGALAGNWRISGRMQDGKMVESQPGPRKTLKLLSGSRFQWVAINAEVKGFYGTGGGTYTFTNGKYTENIEFFSRDSTRVGASLTFDGKVENGAWTHSGTNSRGEPLNEVWRRVKP